MDTPVLNQPYHWLRQIPEELWKLDDTPLLGFSPNFPWKDVATQIAKNLELGPITLTPGEWQWRTQEDFSSGLGKNPQCLNISLPPLQGGIFWLMPETEAKRIADILIKRHISVAPESIENTFYDAIERFITIESLNACEKLYFNGKYSPTLSTGNERPTEPGLCLDVHISHGSDTIHGRLILSNTFRNSWKQAFSKRPPNFLKDSAVAEKLDTIVNLEAGKVNISSAEWKKIHIGDLILLDSCSLDPDEDKGRIMLVVNGIPFFRAKIKQGSVKILEHPLYHEVDVAMTPPNKHDDEHKEEDVDFDDDDEDYTDDDFSDIDLSDLDEDKSHYTEDDSAEHPSSDDQKTALQKTSLKPSAKSPEPAQEIHPEGTKAAGSLEEVPLSIIVEVGRLQMSIKKLLELQPGNMLDLNIHPETGVDLVLNGKRVAKGELLRIGETLGVRIVELS